MLNVEMTAEVTTVSGVSKKTQKQYSFRKQIGFAFLPGLKHPQAIEVMLPDNAEPYPVGMYIAKPTVDRNRHLTFEQKLTPAPRAAAAAPVAAARA